MQKFTRSLTREIEIAGTRLALTLGEEGVSVRMVGTRKPPWEMPWSQVMCHLTDSADPAAAVERIKNDKPPAKAEPTTSATPSQQPAASHTEMHGSDQSQSNEE